jgi:hypothetical protein
LNIKDVLPIPQWCLASLSLPTVLEQQLLVLSQTPDACSLGNPCSELLWPAWTDFLPTLIRLSQSTAADVFRPVSAQPSASARSRSRAKTARS